MTHFSWIAPGDLAFCGQNPRKMNESYIWSESEIPGAWIYLKWKDRARISFQFVIIILANFKSAYFLINEKQILWLFLLKIRGRCTTRKNLKLCHTLWWDRPLLPKIIENWTISIYCLFKVSTATLTVDSCILEEIDRLSSTFKFVNILSLDDEGTIELEFDRLPKIRLNLISGCFLPPHFV